MSLHATMQCQWTSTAVSDASDWGATQASIPQRNLRFFNQRFVSHFEAKPPKFALQNAIGTCCNGKSQFRHKNAESETEKKTRRKSRQNNRDRDDPTNKDTTQRTEKHNVNRNRPKVDQIPMDSEKQTQNTDRE